MKKRYNESNPPIPKNLKLRKRHDEAYYTAELLIYLSPEVKEGLIDIAINEDRSVSWIVNEVFKMYFGLQDDTEYLGLGLKRVRRIK